MNNYAVIIGNLVTNIIVADSKEIAEEVTKSTCIQYIDNVNIGDIWNGTEFVTPTLVTVEEPTND
jgi:hypothetical protein